MRHPLSAATIMLIMISSAKAESASIGLGNQTCGEFAKLYQSAPGEVENYYYSWAQGFMSGMNFNELQATGNSQDLSSITTDQQKSFLRNYCNDHPLSNYINGVLQLFLKFAHSKPVKK